MKVVLIGSQGTVGSLVRKNLEAAGHTVIGLGRSSKEVALDMTDHASLRAAFEKIGRFDALAIAAGDVAFAPLTEITPAQWQFSLGSKLMGQIHLAQQAIPYLNDGGSLTLISGILGEEFIRAGAMAATVNSAIQGFAQAAACELPRGLRINVVSPTVLEESLKVYGAFFPGFTAVPGEKVAHAYAKSILGCETGRIYRVH